jgi:hypothetical protein
MVSVSLNILLIRSGINVSHAVVLIFSFNSLLVIIIISNGCNPLDRGASETASKIVSILCCSTILPFFAFVA